MTLDPVVTDAAAERKRKRLEAWRARQQAAVSSTTPPPVAPIAEKPKKKVTLSLGVGLVKKRKKKYKKPKFKALVDEEDEDTPQHKANPLAEEDEGVDRKRRRAFDLSDDANDDDVQNETPRKRKKKGSRWDQSPKAGTVQSDTNPGVDDALDKFMDMLEAGAMGSVATQQETNANIMSSKNKVALSIDVGGSMIRKTHSTTSSQPMIPPVSGGVITADQLAQMSGASKSRTASASEVKSVFTASDWESDAPNHASESASEAETDDEEEENARRSFIEALKNAAPIVDEKKENDEDDTPQLAAEVKSEKQRREDRLRQLEREAEQARHSAEAEAAPEIGRLYNDGEGGVMEEAERTLGVLNAAPDALEVLAELNKKKELKAVDHNIIDYLPVKKNLYMVPRSLASLSEEGIIDRRAKLKVKVRGRGAPAPVSNFQECGLSERIIAILDKQKITQPFPRPHWACACSGKRVGCSNSLGLQGVCEESWNQVSAIKLGSTAVYGGAGVAEQIADLKRGTHIAVATPGRMIDILTMQSGKILSLQRVSYVVMDESDRMFDMGFAPQISAILSAVRPDRQTVLFSATFPKTIENLARKSLQYPIEVIVGGRSVASDSITQYGEVVEEDEKFLRLLQLLGENVDDQKKVIVFVDTQVRADSLFEQLVRCGYVSLSLHGGKEQEDRDSTISDFKKKDGPGVLVATSVAGRGLDVPSCVCVINYSCPNHLEDYVHRVGRTGRASNKGVAYTFVNSSDEAKFAPNIVRAMLEAGQAENISPELKALSDSYKEKIKSGEARRAGSGYKGKGFTYDSSELSDAQKLARLEKRQALIEAGMIDADEEDPALGDLLPNSGADNQDGEDRTSEKVSGNGEEKAEVKLSAGLLALPGMREAMMRKAGIPMGESEGRVNSTGSNHFVEEMEINDYPREARWKVTQKETTSRLQDEFQTAVTLKGSHFGPNRVPAEGERKLYLHLEATSERILQNCIVEIRRLLNEETLRVGAKSLGGGQSGSSRYSVL
eukprot:scaffold20686_cov42-Attheya_sp.AAC.1